MKKNLKLLVRAKSSALIVILAPLMIILLVGVAYNSTQTGLNIGIHSPTYTNEINSFLTSLQEENYKTIKYDKPKDCIEDIKLGFVHTCLVLPKDFQINSNDKKEITFYIDQSKINLVYMITSTLNKKFNLKSQEISENIVSGVLSKIANTQKSIKANAPKITSAKGKNQEAVKQSNMVKSELGAIDFNIKVVNHDDTIINTFKASSATQTETAITALSAARSAVSSSDLNSTQKAAINNNIDNANTSLKTLVDLINGTGAGSISQISILVKNLKSDFSAAKLKLDDAGKKVTTSSGKLNNINTALSNGISSLDALKKTLDTIEKDLASQKVNSASTIASPLTTKIEKVAVDTTHLGYMFPSLMVLVVMFISLLLGTTLVMMEKHSPAYFRNFTVPVRKITFVFSTYLTNSFLILIQIIIILGISLTFLKDVLAQLPLTALILFMSSSVFTLIGMMIGYIFTSEDTGTLASISTGSLFLFVSGVVLPLENIPSGIRQITYFNPFVIGEKLIRETF